MKVLVQRNPIFSRCPECKAVGSLHRSRARGTWEQFVKKFTFFNMYRCKECSWRGYKSNIIITSQSVKTLLFYILLAVVAGLIIRVVITRFIS